MPQRRFDLDLLHAFEAVATHGSLTAASRALHRSQSAVSEQIRKLEEFCAAKLFDRGKQGASLTPAGERLLAHSRKLLMHNDLAYDDMRETGVEGELRIAITDYFRPAAITELLRRLGQQFPRVRLHVSIRKSALIETDVAGEFDVGVSMRVLGLERPDAGDDFRRVPLRREPLEWVAGSAWEPAGFPVPLLVLPATCSLQAYVLQRLAASKVPHFIAHSASGVGGLQSAVGAGLGVTCLNASAIPPGVKTIDSVGMRLPTMPQVEFRMLLPRTPRADLPARVCERLAVEFVGRSMTGV